MTSAALHLSAPTVVERRILTFARHLTALVEHRIAARAERREIALDLLHQRQTHRHDSRAVEHLLAQMGVPGS
ncbi:hypothetical protein [Microbacterium sp. 1.5R]|uniref:hypothetical protein n=1 Tax=Microbacterium sp. 1.5R TaxID=1916917 RepID=UPI0011A37D73|nr:hypothetical protein [Microbacterium sp. 1.5R]